MQRSAGLAHARRVALGAVAAVAVGALLGCSEDPSPEPTPVTTSSPEVTQSPEAEPAAEVEAEVLEVYYRFWDAMVAVQGGDPDPALFADNATGALVEEEVASARQLEEFGVVREGAPTFSDVTVEVEGETAVVYACVDNTDWLVPGVERAEELVLAGGRSLELIDGRWLVTGSVEAPADLAC